MPRISASVPLLSYPSKKSHVLMELSVSARWRTQEA
jgi:hypothetical protein